MSPTFGIYPWLIRAWCSLIMCPYTVSFSRGLMVSLPGMAARYSWTCMGSWFESQSTLCSELGVIRSHRKLLKESDMSLSEVFNLPFDIIGPKVFAL